MNQLLTREELREIENRLDFLASLAENTETDIEAVETEIDFLIMLLISARKKARIKESGLRVVS